MVAWTKLRRKSWQILADRAEGVDPRGRIVPMPIPESMQHETDAVQPRLIFILGISVRSGTTYLQDLLRLHPDCDVDGVELEEDHFLAYADRLVEYTKLVTRNWKSGPEQLRRERDLVCQCIGDGLLSYLRLQVGNRRELAGRRNGKPLRALVTKTPSITNLHLFFKMFPNADLLILLRDGRSVTESTMKTFYRSFVEEAGRWAAGCAQIQRFVETESNRGGRFLLVRYEDLYSRTEAELRKVMEFLRLDPAVYDFSAAMNIPVRGSSTLRQNGAEWSQSALAPGIHWNPVPKTPDFRPLERWSHWNRAQHERFNWIAGSWLEYFGYEVKAYRGNRWLWTIWNVVLDICPIEKATHLWRKIRREVQFASNASGQAVPIRPLLVKFWCRFKPM
jgi:protein-tyrosine sulfotransferase